MKLHVWPSGDEVKILVAWLSSQGDRASYQKGQTAGAFADGVVTGSWPWLA